MIELSKIRSSVDDSSKQPRNRVTPTGSAAESSFIAVGMSGSENDASTQEKTILLAARAKAGDMAHPPAWNLLQEGLPARWSLSILSMFGFVFLYALRFNISQALVAMTGNVSYCNGTAADPEFAWDKESIGFIQSSFFYGYTVMSLPGGWLAGYFGSKRVIGVAMLLNAVLCLLTPVTATLGPQPLIALRVVQGLVQAPFYPAMHRMWGRWAPQADVGALSSVSYSGPYVGNILSYLLGGYLSVHGFGANPGVEYCGANWPSVFYVFGIGAIVWTVLWFVLAADTPSRHPRISHAERSYIEKNLASNNVDPEDRSDDEPYALIDLLPFVACMSYRDRCRVPWRAILCSGPVWAMCVSLLTFDYGMYTLMTNVPTYLKDVEKLDITSSGIFSALPFLVMWVMTLVAGALTALPIVQNNLSFTVQRKVLTAIGSIIPAVFLVLAGYSLSKTVVISYITIATGVSGFQMIGSGINAIDLAPRYADILGAFGNLWASMGGIAAPYVAATLTPNGTAGEWRLVFYITSGLFVSGAVFFSVFGSAERQWWAVGSPPTCGLQSSLGRTHQIIQSRQSINSVKEPRADV